MILTKQSINIIPSSDDFLNLVSSQKPHIAEVFGQFMFEPEDVFAIENAFASKGVSPYLYGGSFAQLNENKSKVFEVSYDENSLDIIKINDPTIVWGVGKYFQKVG